MCAVSNKAVGARVPALVALIALLALMACEGTQESARDHSEKVLRFVPQSDLEILDPIWTTPYVTWNHGYMIYDMLFGMDAEGRIAPQMVDKWEVGKDRRIDQCAAFGGSAFFVQGM